MSKTNQAPVTDPLTGMTFCPVFYKKPVVKTMGVIFDKPPTVGTLRAQRKPPVVKDKNAACLAGVDWTEDVVIGRVYKADDYKQFYIEYTAPKTKAGMPTFSNMFNKYLTWPMVEG